MTAARLRDGGATGARWLTALTTAGRVDVKAALVNPALGRPLPAVGASRSGEGRRSVVRLSIADGGVDVSVDVSVDDGGESGVEVGRLRSAAELGFAPKPTSSASTSIV